MVVTARFLLLCAALLVFPDLMLVKIAFAADSTVTITPTQGPPGTGVEGIGANWQPADRMQISWDSGDILANTTVKSDRSFSASFNIPSNASQGVHAIYFTDLDSRYFLVAMFTVAAGSARADLIPTAILYNSADLVLGKAVFFDSGVQNAGAQGTGIFNIRWFVDGVSVGYGSHAGVPANSTVLNGNSQYTWVATGGIHTIRFAVDVDNQVAESNESNNSRSITVTVKPTRTTVKSDNFAGYAVAGSKTHHIAYKNVTATWQVSDVVDCVGTTDDSATWAGFTDSLGADVSDLVQAGTESRCGPGVVTQKIYYAVWQVYNKRKTDGPNRIYSFPVFPGNKVKVELKSYGFGEFGIDIWNITLGLHWQKVVSGDNASNATAAAECIQEAPTKILAHFSRVTITCTADMHPIGSAGDIVQKFVMSKMKVGDLNASGGGGTFIVDWVTR